MSYATLADLRNVAAIYGVLIPSDDDAQQALDLASHDLDLALLGVGTFDITVLTPTQVDALSDACAIQACFRLQQGGDLMLGTDDGVSAVGAISFSRQTPARLSPEAADRIAGLGLLRRSGCAPPAPPRDPVDAGWPWPLPYPF